MAVVLAALSALACWIATTPSVASAAPACTRYAAPNGSDSAAGTASAPFRSAQRLQDSLGPGEVGCLQPNAVYEGRLRLNRSGQPGRPITMTSGPGAGRATVLGELYVPDGASDAVYDNLVINGRTSFRVNPSVNGDRITFTNNVITDENHGICFHLGKPGEGRAEDIVIDGNRIHNCGRLPATGFDHGIYLNTTNNVRITNNYIYDNADYGIHLYPDAQNTYVANNVIDGNGRGITFSGEGSTASSNNTVVNNIISNSKDTSNVESYWGGPTGTGNRADGNCLWNGARGNIGTQRGFSVTDNLVADPLFADRGAKNFALRAGSPCAGKGPGAPLSGSPAPAPAASAPAALTPRTRALRTLRLGMRWVSDSVFVVTARPRKAGRLKVVARHGSTVLGACERTVRRAGAAVRCRFTSARAGASTKKVVVAARLAPKRGKGVRVRIAAPLPRKRVLMAEASVKAGRLVVGVRSLKPGDVTVVARAGATKIGQCRKRVVRKKSIGCRFALDGAAGKRVVVTAALDPAVGRRAVTRLARRMIV
ncbi:NosD domain-containing protein [Miltoncostaea marina]|uniref:NosD domain-containing protein n=1 Tax=Miltoncostaea marina TaxID=2843215 RepID=UPI001C3E7790|nr:NosD domain-containing protein [Miltoncostaea marina]